MKIVRIVGILGIAIVMYFALWWDSWPPFFCCIGICGVLVVNSQLEKQHGNKKM